ncbi:cupin domain-containing protein [Chromobacterium subtsugae]|uniref:Cupin domain-containing protein n=2 Tax=Chromobacterium subtsugae TaxID=251747 RepID=A0ABS7FDR5_9NEIS|nr:MULTISPECIES: cupin domain-containing protein [Chromobacterium]KUM02397.1 cupin [Chromobacterium subtsugae]KZE86840.1 cupin [Chromobacterium sp. F49]MBW7566911.1 cupin domain-containing protein [Chromobacterium subtsugae]MBW8288215.1 cupin domain-containing protein [Chromobacterium subtsugae]OBU86619.1 cupin [Chromobacterium subtsugae]
MNTTTLLGGMSPEQFLAEYWHKKPLLIRGALTDVGPHVDFSVLSELAQRDDAESRLIEFKRGRWHLERGPFRASRFRRLAETDWTLLVQGVNHHLPHIDEILWRFNFIPYARLDDLMISYAPPGGTVGPHFDAYDVFLLQVGGRKRWQISAQHDDDFIEDAPIRVLKDFRVEEEFVLEHGDMLYLPPHYAHHGVALEPGMTYSIGFRAPPAQELATQFLVYLQDRMCLDGVYADPNLKLQADPARISAEMIEQVSGLLSRIRWDKDTVCDFLGHYLTEPKAHVFYDAPEEELDEDEFAEALASQGLALDRKSQILFCDDCVYCNGEKLAADAGDFAHWRQFANQRKLAPGTFSADMLASLYDGYLSGYWHLLTDVAQ